jgi:vancomycin permeability regulator SanA
LTRSITPALRDAVLALWGYTAVNADEDLGQDAADIGLALGCHDLAVADHAARLMLDGRVGRLVFSGATSPATRPLFPEGEAVHFARRALAAGVPPQSVVLERHATNTAENFTRTRALLDSKAVAVESGIIVTRPYHKRRALLTARHNWPGVRWRATAGEHDFDAYCAQLGDTNRVINYVVGEVIRIAAYGGERGLLGPADPVPEHLLTTAERLSAAGYGGRPVL